MLAGFGICINILGACAGMVRHRTLVLQDIYSATANLENYLFEMSFFQKVFGAKKNDEGPMPSRTLNFKYNLTPENGSNLAKIFADAVNKTEAIELTYQTDSVDFVNRFLENFRSKGASVNDFAETIFAAGCYTGEVMIRNNGGVWIKQQEANLPNGVCMMPIVVKLSK